MICKVYISFFLCTVDLIGRRTTFLGVAQVKNEYFIKLGLYLVSFFGVMCHVRDLDR
jgi:hypothetical protein